MPIADEAPADWEAWLRLHFPAHIVAPFAPRHRALWGWLAALTPGVRPPARIEIWSRGGAKSSTAELGATYVGQQCLRRFALYVSGTQAQADKHLWSIAGLLESLGVQRAVNRYNHSRGWTQRILRAANGFNVVSLGLDAALRGVKLGQYRPDLIILDDVDDRHDTPDAVEKKISTLTESVLPTGAPDCAVLFVQNLIHGNSIAARLVDGSAPFLLDREAVVCEPAAYDLTYARIEQAGAPARYQVTGGTPTWEGQDLATIEHQINTWGLSAFLREAQHDVGRAGRYFDTWDDTVHVIAPRPIPDDWIVWGAFDYGHAHNTAYGIYAYGDGDVYLIGEHVRNRWRVPQHCEAMDKLHAAVGIPKERLREIAAGHDAFDGSKDSRGLSIADQYAERGYRMTRAAVDRINGWSEVRERLANPALGERPTFYVFDTCPRTIACLKVLVRDPRRPEDVLKVDCDEEGVGGDDPADECRYGLMAAPARLAVEVAESLW